jgi:polysaccharide deacetylase 2 family uncharacterized protein YibQ
VVRQAAIGALALGAALLAPRPSHATLPPAPDSAAAEHRLLCALEDAVDRVDLLPDGDDDMTLRLITENPIEAVRAWQWLTAKGAPKRMTRIKVERPRPMITIVMDDLGLAPGLLPELWGLGQPLTYALIPHLQYTFSYSRWLTDRGASFLIHLPMEPEEAELMTLPGYITEEQRTHERQGIVRAALAVLPGAIGLNNHMGSQITKNTTIMEEIVGAIPPDLVILDSRTSDLSILSKVSASQGRPTATRTVFLDNVLKTEAITEQFMETLRVAKATGRAVAIGHPHKETLQALRTFIAAHGHEIHLVPIERLAEPAARPTFLRNCPKVSWPAVATE